MSTQKDTTKDSTETYVRSSTNEKDADKNKSDKTTFDTSDSSNKFGASTYTRQQQHGTDTDIHKHQSGMQFQQSGMQSGMLSQQQGGYGGHSQQEVQQKLKEVGHLLQKAGSLLQDLQISSGEHGSTSYSPTRPTIGGNYGGPYGGMDSQGPRHSDYYQGQRWQHGPQQGFGQSRWEDREERPFGRGGYRGQECQEPCGFRGNNDRFGGFGGPNRPDMAYAGQYGPENRGGRQDRW